MAAPHCPRLRTVSIILAVHKQKPDAMHPASSIDVLARDSNLCRIPGCTSLKRGKRSLAVHHRVAGNNNPDLMITLCLGHHAMVTRTQLLRKEWPELLRVLWREQHPEGHEQTILNFAVKPVAIKRVPLFPEDRKLVEKL